jgi:hypothetical protein
MACIDTYTYIQTYTSIHVKHFTDPKFHPSDHMMWNTSSVYLLVTGRMHGVSALHTFQNYLCAQRKSVQLLSIFRSHKQQFQKCVVQPVVCHCL